MVFAEINFWAVLAAALANMAVGALWYSPLMFRKSWLAATGRKPEEITGGNIAMARAALNALVTAFVLALFFVWVGVDTYWRGLIVGILASAGFALTTLMLTVIFESKSARLFRINAGNLLVAYATMGAILGAWR